MKQPKKTKQQDKESPQDQYNLLYAMLKSAYIELRELSKKSPNEALSILKVRMLNRILSKLQEFTSKEPTIEYLELLDEESIPSTSDALLILSQYAGALTNYYKRHHVYTDRMESPMFSK